MNRDLNLLLEWSSPWSEFCSSIGPALRPSPPKMRTEAQPGLFPGREMLLVLLVEVAALAAVMARPASITERDQALAPQTHDILYFTADELPRTDDYAGGRAGRHGASGGSSLQHPTQTIKVARGEKLDSRVVDAPSLDLPQSDSQISNLLAYKATVPVAPPSPIVVRADRQRATQQVADAPRVSLPRDAMPSLPESKVTPVAPPTPIRVSREQAKAEQDPAAAPKVQVAREQLPDLPQADVLVKAPPTPIQVTRTRRRSALEVPVPSAPTVATGHEQMPNLPEATVTVKAPPTPIQVARGHRKSEGEVAAPSAAVVESGREQMPDFPQANVAVKAPPTPIQVARGQRRTGSSATTVAAPKINNTGSEAGNQLASVLSTSAGAPGAMPGPSPDSKSVGVIVSPHPGTQAARPKDEEKTTVAMERGGGNTPGSGSNGGGTGMRPGTGTGSSATGTNAGAPAVGTGQGGDLYARNGNSPNLGPGGTGNMTSGTPRAPGISVSGGKNSITLPSFGGPPAPATSGRSEPAKNMGTGITVVASPRAGGALDLYGALKGDRVYTIYINTRIGTAIMQFSDPKSLGRTYPAALTAPQVLRANVAEQDAVGGHLPKVLVICDLDERGEINNARVLQSESDDFAAKILAALPLWKFTPAYRGNQPVAVSAIVGFGVDTN